MRHLNILLVNLVFILLLCAGCSPGGPKETETDQPKPVKTMLLEEQSHPVVLEYTGNVKAKEVINYSFKLPGKISRIHVEEGTKISRGQLLAELNNEDISIALKVSENNLEKAGSYFSHVSETFERIQALYHEGVVPKQEYEEMSLKLNAAGIDLRNAEADYRLKLKMLDDARIVSDRAGQVLKVNSREGEITGAGYPVIVAGSTSQVVSFGVSSQDFARLARGMAGRVIVGDRESRGAITFIAQVPDERTRTYNVEIEIGDNFPLGTFASVFIEAGSVEGILVPISAIMAKDYDYVYVVGPDSRAEKRPVTIETIMGKLVSVRGLAGGENLVIEGMRQLEDGDLVNTTD